jgi:hypothetical protein
LLWEHSVIAPSQIKTWACIYRAISFFLDERLSAIYIYISPRMIDQRSITWTQPTKWPTEPGAPCATPRDHPRPCSLAPRDPARLGPTRRTDQATRSVPQLSPTALSWLSNLPNGWAIYQMAEHYSDLKNDWAILENGWTLLKMTDKISRMEEK